MDKRRSMTSGTVPPVYQDDVKVRIFMEGVGKGDSGRSSADDEVVGSDICHGRTLARCLDIARNFS
jgi:hypothetical protein